MVGGDTVSIVVVESYKLNSRWFLSSYIQQLLFTGIGKVQYTVDNLCIFSNLLTEEIVVLSVVKTCWADFNPSCDRW